MWLVSVLFVYRLTLMLQEEDGPFEVFERLRNAISPTGEATNELAKGFGCFNCLSVWVAIFPSIYLCQNIWEFFIYLLGLSGGAILLKIMIQ